MNSRFWTAFQLLAFACDSSDWFIVSVSIRFAKVIMAFSNASPSILRRDRLLREEERGLLGFLLMAKKELDPVRGADPRLGPASSERERALRSEASLGPSGTSARDIWRDVGEGP